MTYVAAAGNGSENAVKRIRAAYDEVITVSALADFDGQPGGLTASTCRSDTDDTFADFSDYGRDIDLMAPGVCITSTAWQRPAHDQRDLHGRAPRRRRRSPHRRRRGKAQRPTPGEVKTALIKAGTAKWSNRDHRDRTKEALVNVDAF